MSVLLRQLSLDIVVDASRYESIDRIQAAFASLR